MTPPVGADIEALCSKCGDVWHVIVAKVGESIVRVICKECGSQHRYRNPKKAGAAAAPRRSSADPSKPRAARTEKVVERFVTPMVAADLSRPVRSYKATELFTPGDRVDHPTFGQGTVEVSESGKVTICFGVGRKVLVQAKAELPPGRGLSRPRPFDHTSGLPPPKHAPHGHGPVKAADGEEVDVEDDPGN